MKVDDTSINEFPSEAIQQRPSKEEEHGREFCRDVVSAAIEVGQTRVHAEVLLQDVRYGEGVGMHWSLDKLVQVVNHNEWKLGNNRPRKLEKWDK